ncbi:MAG: putative ATP-dependent protease, partial [Proteobacteria bacterium]|nr:putative ATP-dependent protease [Pseudomonadota bacterium]
NLKVILLGEPLLYYLLSEYDPEFSELFKAAVDFGMDMQRNGDSNQLYARLIATLARRDQLLVLDRGAVARVIEYGARLVEDAEKLSVRLREITDLLREADHWAREAGRGVIGATDVQRAIDAKIFRSDRIRERLQEAIQRSTACQWWILAISCSVTRAASLPVSGLVGARCWISSEKSSCPDRFIPKVC